MKLEKFLGGGDLRSTGSVDELIHHIHTQKDFDHLFEMLHHADRLIAMRAADAIEKVIRSNASFLDPHKVEILKLCSTAEHIELKWHLALIVSRLELSPNELNVIWKLLSTWACNQKESKIVRVNALQSLFDIVGSNPKFATRFKKLLSLVAMENVPSINARIKKFRF